MKKLHIDKKKSQETVSNILQKTSDIGKKAVGVAQKSTRAISEKTQKESYLWRIKKYNPLFPEQYRSKDFHVPNIIMIVDDAVRRGIDVCEGSIGWIGKEKGVEVLYLYDEAIEVSGIKFIPAVTCDAIYYVDSFDRNRFIRIDCIFNKAHEERLAELKHIAYSLGAKSCSIQIIESKTEIQMEKKKSELDTNVSGAYGNYNEDTEHSFKGSDQRDGRIQVEFEGSDNPKRPKLKWFAYDENINKLIEMRCKGNNSVKSETLELSGTSSSTMSQGTARTIDSVVGSMGVNGKATMETQAIKENRSKLRFCIEF